MFTLSWESALLLGAMTLTALSSCAEEAHSSDEIAKLHTASAYVDTLSDYVLLSMVSPQDCSKCQLIGTTISDMVSARTFRETRLIAAAPVSRGKELKALSEGNVFFDQFLKLDSAFVAKYATDGYKAFLFSPERVVIARFRLTESADKIAQMLDTIAY